MAKKQVLICGGEGQLGRDCVLALEGGWRVAAPGSKALDITERTAVLEAVEALRPDVILNCAAYTKVDQCETDRDAAWRVNGLGPRNLAEAAATYNALLVHISTDYVFDGRRPPPEPYTEGDRPAPLSVYGRSKLAGEMAVREILDRHMILRTAWLYGAGGHNFLKTMLRLAVSDPERLIRVVNDQYGCPTWTADLARQIGRLMEAGGRGVYHACGEGSCTWYELARRFLERMGVGHRLAPCTTSEYPTAAVRPRNSILENRRLREEGLDLMRPWEEALEAFIALNRRALLEEVNA